MQIAAEGFKAPVTGPLAINRTRAIKTTIKPIIPP